MATPEAEVVKLNDTAPVVQFQRPDFSAFDKPVLGWNITLTNDIDNEDMMIIDFADIPKYNNQVIYKRQNIIIPSGLSTNFIMYVRDITFSLKANRAYTTLVLATNKIMLDNYLPGGLFYETKPTIAQVFDSLRSVMAPFEVDIDSSIALPQANFNLTGQQNILDYLKECFSQDEDELLNWWFDAFNVLHIQKTNGYNSQPLSIDFNVIKNKISNLSVKVQDRWEKREVSVAANLHAPNVTASQPISGQEFSVSGANVNVNGRTIPARTSTSGNSEKETPSLQNVAKNDTQVELELRGFHWLLPHNKASLANFPIDFLQGTFIINKLEVQDRGIPTTNVSLRLAGIDMLSKLRTTDEETSNTEPKKQSGVDVVQSENSRITPAVR